MKKLNITDVKLNDCYIEEDCVYIDFRINDYPYYMPIIKKGGSWESSYVMHEIKVKELECPFCRVNNDDQCMNLPISIEELTEILLNRKEIRLPLLLKGIVKKENS